MYKPTFGELKGLGFTTKHGTDEYHYTAELTSDEYGGITFPTLVNYFSDKNVFLMGAAFYFVPDSLDDLKVVMKVFGENVNKDRNENR